MAILSPYKKYNSIDYDYASQLPDGWQLLPNIAIFEERVERGYEKEELLSVTIGRGVIKQTELDKKDSSTLEKSKYLLVYPNDIVYSMRFRQGASGFSNYKGIVSPACTVLKPRKGVQYNPRLFHYMFRTGFYKNYAERYAYGIADGQMPLRYTDFKRMYSIVPPLEIQNEIVAYLDKKNAAIDKFIRNKERLVELLEEEKRYIINNSITKGLNQIVKMKFIGLDWFKEMPIHWKIRKLKYVFKIRNGQVDPKKYPNFILIAPNHIESGTGEILYEETAIEQSAESGKYLVKKGDIVYSKIRPELNKVCISNVNGLCSADMYAIQTKSGYYNKFIKYLFLCESFNKAMVENSMRVAMPKVNREDVNNFQCAFPDENEQKEIVTFIENETSKINKVISKAQKEISAIKEYREALITDLVTGRRSILQTIKGDNSST